MSEQSTTVAAGSVQEEQPISQILHDVLSCDGRNSLTVGDLMQRMEERGFGLVLILLSIVALIPVLPPGASGVVGMLCIAGSLQMVWGRTTPWLPKRLRAYSLSEKTVNLLRTRGVRLLQSIEKLSRPRLTPFSDVTLLRLASAVVLLMGVIMFLPLPFMNSLPALSVMATAFGLLNRDGVFLMVGAVLAGIVLSLVGVSAKTIWSFLLWLQDWLFSVVWCAFQNVPPM
ncbi:MAG: exopolysaccharide biosynthesis protein [Armatimonadota bacterium]|nr:exopolysaccharide biosynthesis protein [bacterium]MDW8321742.1 exopolysaccharide biosynthesis protein [Armatimonadota bacterium]